MNFTGEKVDWASLPSLPLSLIMDNLHEATDHTWFSAVCKHWNFVSKENLAFKPPQALVPMLLIPTKNINKNTRSLFSIIQNKPYYHLKIKIPFERIRCCGSSYGWLAYTKEKDGNLMITLYNPFKQGVTIDLPHLFFKRNPLKDLELSFRKVILTVDPTLSPNDYIVVAIYSVESRIAYLKSGDKMWTYIDKELKYFTDIILYKGLIYAINNHFGIMSIDVKDGQINTVLRAPQRSMVKYIEKSYLVQSSKGDLLAVQKNLDLSKQNWGWVKDFKVYKLILDEKTRQLNEKIELETLDGDALFVGDNYSICLPGSDDKGCNPNSIYFTHDSLDYFPYTNPHWPSDLGYFNIDDQSLHHHYKVDLQTYNMKTKEHKQTSRKVPVKDKRNRIFPAIWITPPL